VELMVGDDLSGTVEPGRGLGSELMRDQQVAARFEEIAGFPLVLGTLNIRLPGPLVRDRRWRFLSSEEIAPDWTERSGQTGYFLAAVVVEGTHRALAFQAVEPEGPGYPVDQIELLSDTHLRSALGLADGEAITVSLGGAGGS
jgi:CTP-dependent riboflavin kinase